MKRLIQLYLIVGLILWQLTPAHGQAITALPAGAPAQAADLVPMANLSRSGTLAYSLSVSDILNYAGVRVSAGAPVWNSATTLAFYGQGAATPGATVTNNLWTFNGPIVVTAGAQTSNVPSVSISQMWTNAGTTYDAPLLLNVNNQASAAGSLLADFQVGGVSQANIDKAGSAVFLGNVTVNPAASATFLSGGSVRVGNAGAFQMSSVAAGTGSPDTGISRCAAAVICVGNGTAADTTGSIKGVTTNSSAPAGTIGEEREFSVASTGAVVTVSSNTIIVAVSSGANVVAAGDYDATGIVCFSSASATSFTSFMQGFSTAGAVQGALGTYSAESFAAEVPGTITLGTTTNELCKVLPRTRISLASTGNVSLWVRPVFSVSSTISAYGQIMLRRPR